MDQRSKKKIKLFRTLKVFFYCLGVPLFVLAVMLSAGLDFVGELPFSVNEPVLGFNEGIESVFFGSGLYGVWVAFGVWLVIAIIHIILKKTVHNTRARTMLVAVVTFVVMLVPVVVMDIVMPMQLDKLAEETAADGVVIPSYKEQLANYVIKGEVREGYTAEFCEQVEKLLDVYHIEFEPVISNGIASNAANMPVRYEELWRDGDGAYTGDKTGLVKVQPDENGQLVVDGKVYDKYEFKNNVWYKTSRDSDFKDGVYGPAYYNVNGLLSEGYVFGIETVLNILEQYYKGQLDVAALGGNDSDYAKIVKKAAELQEEDYTSDPASEKYFIWKQTGFEIGGVDLNGDGLEEKLSLTKGELNALLNSVGSNVGANAALGKLLTAVPELLALLGLDSSLDLNKISLGGGMYLGITFVQDATLPDYEQGLKVTLSGDAGTLFEETVAIQLNASLIPTIANLLDTVVAKYLGGMGYSSGVDLLNALLNGGEGIFGTVGKLLGLLGVKLPIKVEAGNTTEDVIYNLILDLLGGLYWYSDPEINPVYDYYADAAKELGLSEKLGSAYAMLDRAIYEGGMRGYMIGSTLIPGASLLAGDNLGDGSYPSSFGLASYAAVRQMQVDLQYKSVYYPLYSVRCLLVEFLPFALLFTILSGIAAEREMLFATGQEKAKQKKNRKKDAELGAEDSAATPVLAPQANDVAPLAPTPADTAEPLAYADDGVTTDDLSSEGTDTIVVSDNDQEVR